MCATMIGSTPVTLIVQQTSPVPGLTVTMAVPLPSRSPWFGMPSGVTSASPVQLNLERHTSCRSRRRQDACQQHPNGCEDHRKQTDHDRTRPAHKADGKAGD